MRKNEELSQEFAKLRLDYEQLRFNNQEIEKENKQSQEKINELEELQNNKRDEYKNLQHDLKVLRKATGYNRSIWTVEFRKFIESHRMYGIESSS